MLTGGWQGRTERRMLINTLQKQVQQKLNGKMAIGQSRHAAKNKAREEAKGQGQSTSAVDVRVDTIHSIGTYNAYMEHCTNFVNWAIDEKGVNKYASLKKIEPLAAEYLKEREEKGLSLYTLKAEKAALGKLYGHEIEYKFKEKRTVDKITRSRGETERQKHFSEERNIDLVQICKGTGGRREDIQKLTSQCFFSDDKSLWVVFKSSKGGRDRIAPVLPAYREAIEKFIKGKDPNAPLFDHIHNAADIHSYRREYAKELYSLVKENKEIQHEYLSHYPERIKKQNEYDKYFSRGDKATRFVGYKDDIYIVSQALGHNRLEVSVNHYLI